jgi:6-phosphogluconolactonase
MQKIHFASRSCRMIKLYVIFILSLVIAQVHAQTGKEILYVGTYSVRESQGIYVYEFDRKGGTFNQVQAITAKKNPNFLAIHPSGKFLYSVNGEAVEEFPNAGSVSAYAIDKTGKLTALNSKSAYGRGPCHIAIDQTGKWAFVSNYGEGNISVLSIQADGSLGALTDSIRFYGKSVNQQRQDKPHAHSATVSPDNRFLLVADLGTDKVYSYEIDLLHGKLKPASKPVVSVAPGSGPRHLTFDPSGKYVYLAEELTSTVGVFSYDKKTGGLTIIQDGVKSLPADFTGTNTSADIHTDPKGKYLYMSNRGHNSLAIFSINAKGLLTLMGQQETMGRVPRNFMVDEKNEYVLAANQESDNIVIFKQDQQSGKLAATGVEIKVPSPVCLKMLVLK